VFLLFRLEEGRALLPEFIETARFSLGSIRTGEKTSLRRSVIKFSLNGRGSVLNRSKEAEADMVAPQLQRQRDSLLL